MKEETIKFNGKNYKLSSPIEVIKTFCVLDPSYKRYDLIKLSENWLEECVKAINSGMGTRLKKNIILDRKGEIENAIKNKGRFLEKSIFIDIDLDTYKKHLEEIFNSFRCRGVQNAIITKILHKNIQIQSRSSMKKLVNFTAMIINQTQTKV